MDESLGTHARSAKVYRGGCLCGAVLYEVTLDLAAESPRATSVWERAVPSSAFRLVAGDEQLTGHQFLDQPLHHFYCERCGLRSFSRCASGVERDVYVIDLKSIHQRVVAEPTPHPPRSAMYCRP